VVQILVRAHRNLEVTQLEVRTAAFVNCAIMIYALNWHKPKGAGVPLTLWSFTGPAPPEISSVLGVVQGGWWILTLLFGNIDVERQLRRNIRGLSVPNRHRHQKGGYAGNLETSNEEFFLAWYWQASPSAR
jgi:hypothetical protein